MRSTGNRVARLGDLVYYNEKKQGRNKAERIYAGNFLKDAPDLTAKEIRSRLFAPMETNQLVEKKGIHFVLSFSPAEKPDNKIMSRVAMEFMQRMGIGGQPYVVYRHSDSFTPHLHILSVSIRPDGKPIRLRFFGGIKLWPVYLAIEQKYGLLNYRGPGSRQRAFSLSTPGRSIQYGEKPTIQSIDDAVRHVRENYRFRSVSEFNAILRLFNLRAITGRPGSRLHDYGGLLYQILDNQGNPVATPVRASLIPSKPILKALLVDFARAQQATPAGKEHLISASVRLDEALREAGKQTKHFSDALRRRQLAIAPDQDENGQRKGLLIVDLAAMKTWRAEELGQTQERITQSLGYDPLTPAQAVPSPTQTKSQRKGIRR